MAEKPKVSIITSCDVDHFGSSTKIWPHSSFPYLEVYAFMHNCLDNLFGEGSKQENTIHILANARKGPDEPARIAKLIHEHFVDMKVAAITSFLPEISGPINSEARGQAQAALEFLLLTLAELRDTYHHPCNVLVLVGGSRFDGIWKGEDLAGDKVSVVNRLPTDLAIDRLLKGLKPVAELAASKGIFLAIGLEPGPLFTIGDWDSLLALCDELDKDTGVLNSTIGLNLDIAHWALIANIKIQDVLDNPRVQRRIVHAHISDHDCGHCADAIPATFHSFEIYRPWLQLLTDLTKAEVPSEAKLLPYSGFVSCELESAYNLETVEVATKLVRHWMDNTN